jgi:hypothetical protein
MAGKRGKSGKRKTLLYNRVHRIRIPPQHRDLLSFFEQLDQLPVDRRNDALLLAIRGGASAALESVASGRESQRASAAIDALLGEL